MRYTNATGLADPILRALQGEPYTKVKGHYSVTELLSPPRVAYLQKKHDAELVADVADMADVLIGNAVHKYLKDRVGEGEIAEKRLTITVGQHIVSGEFDWLRLADGLLVDYKTPKVYEWSHPKQERVEQANIYAEIARIHGYKVESLALNMVFKDWTPNQRVFNEDYPKHSIVVRPLEMWPSEQTQDFIRQRLALHLNANDDTLCSDEDRWIETKYAVMKPEAKRATKLFDVEEEAIDFAGDHSNVETRIGEPRRCQFWCSVAPFCEQWKGEQ